MNVLKIENNYSCFHTEDQGIIDTLWKLLRFRERGYFHSRLYKQHKWDGFRDFFSIKTGKFLTGLLPEVRLVLKQLNVEYEVVDNREKFEFYHHEIDKHFMNYGDNPIELYDYQVELVNQILKHKRGIIFAPTGAGKSAILESIVKCLPDKTPTLILANRKTLIEQIYQGLISRGIKNVGRLYGNANEPSYITCSTIQSAEKLDNILSKIKVLLVDEIHEMTCNSAMKIYRKLNNAQVRIAASATAFKFDGKDEVQKYRVKGWFGPPLKVSVNEDKKLTTSFLQDRKILSNAKCIFYPIREPMLPYAIYQDAVLYGIAESSYFNNVVFNLCNNLKGRTLILVERIPHGNNLHNMIKDSIWISGEDNMEDRHKAIQCLRNSKNAYVIATHQILNTGIDFKIHNLINAASGQADHLILQRIGRGLRTADDKYILNYYDFMFEINPYLKNHSEKRIKILQKHGHNVIIQEIDF